MSLVSITNIPTNTPEPSLHPSCRAGPAGSTQEDGCSVRPGFCGRRGWSFISLWWLSLLLDHSPVGLWCVDCKQKSQIARQRDESSKRIWQEVQSREREWRICWKKPWRRRRKETLLQYLTLIKVKKSATSAQIQHEICRVIATKEIKYM